MTEVNSPEDAELLVQKLPSDMGIHRNARKGTLNAPGEILEDFEFSLTVMVDEVFPDEFDMEETQDSIEENTSELLEYCKPLLSIGGDHSVSFPVIKEMKQRHPGLQLVWLDAHLDMKEKVDGHVSHDVVPRELLDHGFDPSDVWFVGVTRIDGDEEEFLENHDFNIYRSDEIDEFLREFDPGEQPVYLSVDIDVLEKELAPGTGYPDGELSMEQVEEVIDTVEPSFADLVEVAPPLDQDGKTVEKARRTLGNLESVL
ncbi:MAG: arginase family protein [Candidatus Nanohaloarchaea archaeon]